MNTALIFPAFFAGLLTFLAPCTLPLVPGYLAFISGASLTDLQNSQKAASAKRKVFLNGLAFVVGFSLIFIFFGSLAGFLGSSLAIYRIWLTRIAGIFVIVFGLFMLNVLRIPFLLRETGGLKVSRVFERGKPLNSLILGSSFGIGWTPCVGPILASILLLASTSTTAWQGAALLSVFSAGLAIPFLLIALGIGAASRLIARFGRILNYASVIGGIFLIGLGILLFTNQWYWLVAKGYQLFKFINYDKLINFL